MFIAFDSHKKYTFASVCDAEGKIKKQGRIEHSREAIGKFLSLWECGSPVAVETIGNWYWIIDEIEKAGMDPKLVHARKAKLMMGMINKTDKLDAEGMNRLQRNGTLPTVWIPPGELRDQRELPRARMVFCKQRTQIKNRIHASLAKYGIQLPEVSDIFSKSGRKILDTHLPKLPVYSQETTKQFLKELDFVEEQIQKLDKQIETLFEETEDLKLLKSLPGIGFILGIVLLLEIGDVDRFATPSHLAAYAGTVPRIHSSGGKTRHGQARSDVNRYLKWAFYEAGNSVSLNRTRYPDRHVSQLYSRVRQSKGHPKAIGAVARHLAEAAHVVLTKKKAYEEPGLKKAVSSRKGNARQTHES